MTETATISAEQRPYSPHGAAMQLFYCQDAEILIEGPAGTGKTRAVLEKVHLCLMKYAGARALICRKTRAAMTQSVLVTLEEKVLPVNSPIASGPARNNRTSYVYPNGSELVIGGLDNADRIMSTEYDVIAVFEATELTEDDWEKLMTRLRNGAMPYQQAIADCNPGAPTHWLNQRAKAGRMTRLQSRHEDNPTVTESYLTTLRSLTGVRRERLYEGKWAAQEGLVYDLRPHHILPRFEIPADWRRIRAIDFGYTNPFVCHWWAVDHDGRMYLYREIYMTRRTVRVHAEQIVELSTRRDAGVRHPDLIEYVPEEYEATIADHDAEDRATLDEFGIWTMPAYKSITTGINNVQERLAVAGDGKPRLFILENSLVERDELLAEQKKPVCTLDEFDLYTWPKGADGKELKETPVKVNDHGMDTLRYAAAYVDGLGVQPPSITFMDL